MQEVENLEVKRRGVCGQVTQRLRAQTVLPKDLSSVASTHIR